MPDPVRPDRPRPRPRLHRAGGRRQGPPAATDDEVSAAITAHHVYEVYTAPDPLLTAAAKAALGKISLTVGAMQTADLAMDALSLAALSMDIVRGHTGILSPGHMAFFALGGYMIGQWLMSARTDEIVVQALSTSPLPATSE